jgi:hypothetical protein
MTIFVENAACLRPFRDGHRETMATVYSRCIDQVERPLPAGEERPRLPGAGAARERTT